MTLPLTPEQAAILAHDTSRPLQVVAYAGTGKSTTIGLLDRASPPSPRLYLAFNKHIVAEMKDEENPRLAPTTDCRTINSLGARVFSSMISPRVLINKKKTTEIFKEVIKPFSKDIINELWESYDEIRAAYDLCKAYGYLPTSHPKAAASLATQTDVSLASDGPVPHWDVVDSMLVLSIRRAFAGDIDFNDQLYMPALFATSWPRYSRLYLDEAQDFSRVNYAMIRKMAGKSTVIYSVGDPYQSIYAFRGAMTDGMARQRKEFSCETLPLSVSFRCPSAIVANARWRAPGFKAFRNGGEVQTIDQFSGICVEDFVENSSVICRNNAPLFSLAMRLLARGRSVDMAGTDIGPRLVSILRRLGDMSISRPAILAAIDEWEERHEASKSTFDTAECLRAIASSPAAHDLGTTVAYVEHLYKQKGTIHLTTGHKAKGLEWDTVYHLDPSLLGRSEQDLNLRYVIETRSKESYFEIDSRGIS